MSDLEPLIDALLDPAVYPHPVTEPIHHIQTHISHVLLTGDYAYKIKKPVNLGFLDYSTLENRRRFCYREVELNRQFAPHLYLDVVPIYQTSNGFSLNPPDPQPNPVEYAVKMNQFREEDVLLQVFQRGELTQTDVLELARRLAEVHQTAVTDDIIAAYGTPDAVRDMARGNLELVRPFIGKTVSKSTFSNIESKTMEFFDRHAGLLEERVRTGRICECHGDLHLNNICRYEGRLQFFDRIEFNDTFKNIDAIYDLAFLLMDIRFRGRPDLTVILLNEYLEHTGDYEGALLLPVYVSMRAFIRGEVQSILATETEIDLATREAAADEARRYFNHALATLTSTDARLILIGGVSGSGKSHLARAIAPQLDAIHIRSDAVRKHLAGVGLDEKRKDLYSEDFTRKTYDRLADLGCRIAAEGRTVILDATWLSRDRRKTVLTNARRRGIETALIFCTAPDRILEKRLARRLHDASDATIEVMRAQQPAVEPPGTDEADLVAMVDTTDTSATENTLEALKH